MSLETGSTGIGCWKCGASLAALALPFGRTERCRACGTDLHACRLCANYDPRAYQQCREPTVEEVRDKERANFCGWFTPRPGAWSGTSARPAADAIADLEALFGGARPAADPDPDDARRALEDLFGPGKPDDGGR